MFHGNSAFYSNFLWTWNSSKNIYIKSVNFQKHKNKRKKSLFYPCQPQPKVPGKSQNKQQSQLKPKTIIYLDQTQEKETVYKSIKNKMSKHKSDHTVDRLKVKTKKAKSVLGSNSKCQLLRRPDGLVCLPTTYPEKHCTFESKTIWRGTERT